MYMYMYMYTRCTPHIHVHPGWLPVFHSSLKNVPEPFHHVHMGIEMYTYKCTCTCTEHEMNVKPALASYAAIGCVQLYMYSACVYSNKPCECACTNVHFTLHVGTGCQKTGHEVGVAYTCMYMTNICCKTLIEMHELHV